MSEKPLISVLMNGYNSEQFLEATLQSLIAQTYDGWQLVFIDNHSTDNTREIVHKYMEPFNLDYRVTPQHMPLGEAREYGLSFCRGEFICFLDTDDLWKPQKLELQLKAFQLYPQAMICYSAYEDIDGVNKVIHIHPRKACVGNLFGENLAQYQVNFQTVMIPRTALDKLSVPYFNPILQYSPDYNLIMRVLGVGEAICLSEMLVSYRKTGNSLTNKSVHRWAEEAQITYDQMEREGLMTALCTPGQRRRAEAKIAYYSACYQYALGDMKALRQVLKPYCGLSLRYFLLYLSGIHPILWALIHRFK